MALAGASQRRYINVTGQQLRGQLVGRIRTMLLNRRPAVAVPNYVLHGRRCENGLCRATLPAGAQVCPRCGSALPPARVAGVGRGTFVLRTTGGGGGGVVAGDLVWKFKLTHVGQDD